jgi:hypothetical protein
MYVCMYVYVCVRVRVRVRACMYVCMYAVVCDVWQRLPTPSLQLSLSSQFPSRRSHSYIALSTLSFHLVFGLPLFPFPVGVQLKIF